MSGVSEQVSRRWRELQEIDESFKALKGKPTPDQIAAIRKHRQTKREFLESLNENDRAHINALFRNSSKGEVDIKEEQEKKLEAEREILKSFAVQGCSLIDIGINLHAKLKFDRLKEILISASTAGVSRIILTGCSLESSRQGRDVCDRWYIYIKGHEESQLKVYHTVGIHPHDAKAVVKDGKIDQKALQTLQDLAQQPFAVSLGECGLDYDRMFSPLKIQKEVFRAQIQLACALNKPLFVHLRERDADKGAPLGIRSFFGRITISAAYRSS